MDEQRFDDIVRRIGAISAPRRTIAALVAGLLAGTGLEGELKAGVKHRRGKTRGQERGHHKDRQRRTGRREQSRVAAEKQGRGNGKKGKGKGKGKGNDKPKPNPGTCRTHDDCRNGKVCCAGACREPGQNTCCTRSEQCGDAWGCLWCDGGQCRPVPDGRECADCKRCRAGACTEPDDRLLCGGVCCPEDEVCVGVIFEECCLVEKACANDCCAANEHCNPETRECCTSCGAACCDPETHFCRNPQDNDCCPRCENDQCCPIGQQCVDTGPLGSRTCCDRPCGLREDGTFRDCCDPGESCLDGECRIECPGGKPPCGDECCDAGERCCDAANGPCVPFQDPGTCCPGEEACGETCCPPDVPCTAEGCCFQNPTHLACDGHCVNPQTDNRHCGACGNHCGRCGTCVNGACVSLCEEGSACCAGVCCPTGRCCGRGTHSESCCRQDEGLCCTGGTAPGFETTCCFTEPNLHFCKVGPEGPNGRRAICSTIP